MTRDVPAGRSRYIALAGIVSARNYRFGNRLYVIQIIWALLYGGETDGALPRLAGSFLRYFL